MNSDNYSPIDNIAKTISLKKPVKILYLGDSLTAFDLGNNHADKVRYFLNKYNPGMAQVWNYAAGGDEMERVVKRLNGDGEGKYSVYFSGA